MAANRLAKSSSPYLRQHKDNPVHWQPWDDAALRRAASEDKPIFLSVGYSSCHWCHVMEHESFLDANVAETLNEHFINIKVDREERPDIDETYMAAVQIANGHGGWPMSVFLTPDFRPFWAGTYLPKEDRGPQPGFKTLIRYLAQVWTQRRAEIDHAAGEFANALRQLLAHEVETDGARIRDRTELLAGAESEAISHLRHEGKPKFPPHSMLRFLLYRAEHASSTDALRAAEQVLTGMMLGGIQDQVGGGFHRYSTDERWLLPHFEKMLYDNGLMLRNYADAYRITRNAEYKRVCERLVDWAQREMLSPEGFFYSALDADSEGEEGKYYVWRDDELPADNEFRKRFGIRGEGNFRDEASGELSGANILYLNEPVGERFDGQLAELKKKRAKRTAPGLDDKCLVAWNGLMISGLCAFDRQDLAARCADAILAYSTLPHQIVNGVAEGIPFLDQSYFIEGLLDLAESTGSNDYRDAATNLFESAVHEFRQNGAWTFTGSRHQELFGRSKPVADNATPSPSAVMTRCALRLGNREIVESDMARAAPWMEHAPAACSSYLQVLAMLPESLGEPNIQKVSVLTEPRESQVEDGRAHFRVLLTPPPGWHLEEAKVLKVTGMEDLAIDGLEISGAPGPGKEGEAKAVVRFQACNDRECLLPEEREISLVWYRG
jgi:uncharacterized protein YyaL (SSP411 family)